MAKKRKTVTCPDSDVSRNKRIKLSSAADSSYAVNVTQVTKPAVADENAAGPSTSEPPDLNSSNEKTVKTTRKGKEKNIETDTTSQPGRPSTKKPRCRINKLEPPRPFPTVPTSVSATGPRSAHLEGKNLICMTRKTPLSAYLRRCKDVIIKDGCALCLS